MKRATFIMKVNPGSRGDQKLWKLSEPIEYDMDYETGEFRHETDFVVTSAAVVPFSGAEVLVFPASENGEILDWLEVGGYRGGLDHEHALEMMEWL